MTTALLTAMALTTIGCGSQELNDAERAQKVIEAYQTGDFEVFQSYLDTESSMNYMIAALDDTNAEGMPEVYQKAYELTKSAEFTIAEELEPVANDGYVTIRIKTVDFSNAIQEAMLEAANESAEAFADIPTWMMKALSTGGEPVEREASIDTLEGFGIATAGADGELCLSATIEELESMGYTCETTDFGSGVSLE